MNFLEAKVENNKFLIDTGAQISIINENRLKKKIKIINDKIDLKGIGENLIKTMGFCYLTIIFKNKNIKHKFHVVPKEFQLSSDGIIGFDFMETNNVIINCQKKLISIDKQLEDNLEKPIDTNIIMNNIKINKEHILKARHINLIKVNVDSNKEGIINKIILPQDLYMAHTMVSPVNNETYISIVNISEKEY